MPALLTLAMCFTSGNPFRRFLFCLPIICSLSVSGFATQDPSVPVSSESLFQSGLASLSQGKYPEAEESFRKIIELEPENLRGVIGLAEAYIGQKRENDAIRLLQAESQKRPNRPELHVAMGDVASRGARYDLAISEYQQALDYIDRSSQSAGNVYLRMAEAYRRKGDTEFSIDLMRQASKLQPQNVDLAGAIAYQLEASGQRQAAEAEYRRLLQANPNNALFLNNLAFLLAESDPTLALAYAHRAKQQLPNELTVADTLGWVYLKVNQTENALAIFRDIVQKEPRRAVFRYHLATALKQSGDHASARRELEAALQNQPSKEEEKQIHELLRQLK